DEVAIGVINHKTTAVRIIPVPGKGAGNRAVFGGLFWRDCHPSRPRRGRLDAFRPSRRPHPRTAFQPSKLKKPKNLWKKCGRSLHFSRSKRIGRACTDSTQSINGGWSHDDASTDPTHDRHRGAGRLDGNGRVGGQDHPGAERWQNPAPLPQTATMPENLPKEGQETPKARSNDVPEALPIPPASGASSKPESVPPPPLPAAGAHLAAKESPSPPPDMGDLAPTQQSSAASEPAGIRTLTENQPAPSSDDPEQSAQSFVQRNQKEAEDHLSALTAEAQQLRARLAKLESGIKKWQCLVSALKSSQGQPVTSTANAPGAEDAGDLEPIKPSQAGGARTDKRVKWATATSAATGAGAQAGENVNPPQQLPAGQPLQVVVPGPAPR